MLGFFLLLTAWFAWLVQEDLAPSLFHTLVFYFGLIVFSGISLLLLRLIVKRGPALRLSPDGIVDARYMDKPIPWSSVSLVTGYKMRRQNFVFVGFSPVSLLGEKMKRSARWMNFGQTPLGLHIGLALLAVKQEELRRIIEAYARAHGAPLAKT